MGLLMTPTLLDSKDWLMNCPESWKDSAYNSIKSTLSREPFKPTKPILEGQKFENYVYENANKPKEIMKGSAKFQEVCEKVRGYAYQKKTTRHIIIDEHEFFLYGRIDAIRLKPEKHIKDIKTTANYRGRDSYLSKWQHKFYCFSEVCNNFTYIIVEWIDKDTFKIKDVHDIPYRVEQPEELVADIESGIRNFLDFLSEHKELERLYFNDYQPAWKRK